MGEPTLLLKGGKIWEAKSGAQKVGAIWVAKFHAQKVIGVWEPEGWSHLGNQIWFPEGWSHPVPLREGAKKNTFHDIFLN